MIEPDGEQGLQAVNGGDGHGGRGEEIAAQGEDELADENARPDAGAEAQGKGEGEGLWGEKDRGDEDVIDLGEETEPAGKGVEEGENGGGKRGSAEPGAKKVQGG